MKGLALTISVALAACNSHDAPVRTEGTMASAPVVSASVAATASVTPSATAVPTVVMLTNGSSDQAPWGREDGDAGGNMFGDTIGDSFGAGGLGLSGVGDGGGGQGEGIGLGNIGTLGHGAGTGGFGNGHGRLGDHHVDAPHIRQGAVTVVGQLPSEVIQRIVRQNFGRFRLCYEEGLRTDPKLAGVVAVHFVIDRSGAVSKNERHPSTAMPDAGVASCVVRGFGNLSFPQPEAGTVDVVYPIAFEPAASK